MNPMEVDRVKIAFRLIQDADDLPPADWEHLWAIKHGDNEFEIDNIPFFVKGISSGDTVTAHADDGLLIFDKILRAGGHSTIRVIMFDENQKIAVRDALAHLGCETEGSHLPILFAVDVPPQADFNLIVDFLIEKASDDVLDYEEAAVQHVE